MAAFRPVYPGTVRLQLAQWAEAARAQGVIAELRETLRHIDSQLKLQPLTWGEPSGHAKHANLVTCDGFCNRVHVHYAVDDGRRLVYVLNMRLLPGHPLYRPE